MSDIKRDIACSKCIHSDVCIHKQDFIDMNNAIFSATVKRTYKNDINTACCLKLVSNFECFGSVIVTCRYFTDSRLKRQRGGEEP